MRKQYSKSLNSTSISKRLGQILLNLDREPEASRRKVSAGTQRNIDLLRSAILTNKDVLSRLETSQDVESSNEESYFHSDEGSARAQLDQELAEASAYSSQASGGPHVPNFGPLMDSSHFTSWETVLLRSYKSLTEEVSAAEVLECTIPEKVKMNRAAERDVQVKEMLEDHEMLFSENNTDGEIKVFMNEWTTVPQSEVESCLEREEQQKRTTIPGVPSWVENG